MNAPDTDEPRPPQPRTPQTGADQPDADESSSDGPGSGGAGSAGEPDPSEHLRTIARSSRQRVDHAHRLRAEQRLISAQSAARVAESRLLLDRAFVRAQVPVPSLQR